MFYEWTNTLLQWALDKIDGLDPVEKALHVSSESMFCQKCSDADGNPTIMGFDATSMGLLVSRTPTSWQSHYFNKDREQKLPPSLLGKYATFRSLTQSDMFMVTGHIGEWILGSITGKYKVRANSAGYDPFTAAHYDEMKRQLQACWQTGSLSIDQEGQTAMYYAFEDLSYDQVRAHGQDDHVMIVHTFASKSPVPTSPHGLALALAATLLSLGHSAETRIPGIYAAVPPYAAYAQHFACVGTYSLPLRITYHCFYRRCGKNCYYRLRGKN